MVGAQRGLAQGERDLVQFDGLGRLANHRVGSRQVIAPGERAAVVPAEHSFDLRRLVSKSAIAS